MKAIGGNHLDGDSMTNEQKLKLLAEKVSVCQKCQELVENRTQTVFGEGNPNSKIVFIGEAPGKNEDENGVPFVGKAGQLLTNILASCGLKREGIYILNILKCRPPGNRTPTDQECENCRPFLELQLKIVNPTFIVCLGAVAANNILKRKEGIGRLRGSWFKYENPPVNASVICTFHPAFLLRNPAAKKEVWEDMQTLLGKMKFTTQEAVV